MSDKPYYAEESHARMLRTWVLGQMMRGAGWAAAFLLAIILTLYAIWGVGLLLPDASKEAPPPMGAVEQTMRTALV